MKETKEHKKESTSFSLDKEIKGELFSHCQSHMINKSQLVESLIKDYLDSIRAIKNSPAKSNGN